MNKPCVCQGILPTVIKAGTALGACTGVFVDGQAIKTLCSVDLTTGWTEGFNVIDGRAEVDPATRDFVVVRRQLRAFELVCRRCGSTFFSFKR